MTFSLRDKTLGFTRLHRSPLNCGNALNERLYDDPGTASTATELHRLGWWGRPSGGSTGKPYLRNLTAIIYFMKVASPTLLPLLRSRSQGDILAAILLQPDRERSMTEIANETGTSLPTVQREVARLEEAGLVTTTKRGNTRLVRPVTDSVVYRPLADLLAVTFGPVAVLRDALADVPGIDRAFIYGSWAARYAQHPGPVPNDIDLLVIGDIDRHVLAEVLADAETTLRRDVNVRRVTRDAWDNDTGSFARTVKSRPLVNLIGGDDE